MESDRERGGDYQGEFLARSRVLALIVAVGSIALVVLVLVLPLTMEHAFEGAQLLLWGSLLLVITLIVGISLVYAYMSKYIGVSRGMDTPSTASREEAFEGREELTLQLLPEDERAVYRRLLHEGGQVLQKDLHRMLSFSGPKLTRVLDRLERKELVVRERHGMTNRIRLRRGEV